MKTFMTNACYHPHCRLTNCKKCFFYSPKFFGIRVPKFLGNILYKLEYLILKGEN